MYQSEWFIENGTGTDPFQSNHAIWAASGCSEWSLPTMATRPSSLATQIPHKDIKLNCIISFHASSPVYTAARFTPLGCVYPCRPICFLCVWVSPCVRQCLQKWLITQLKILVSKALWFIWQLMKYRVYNRLHNLTSLITTVWLVGAYLTWLRTNQSHCCY